VIRVFALASTAVKRTAMTAAEQARQRPLLKLVARESPSLGAEFQYTLETKEIEPSNESEQVRPALAKFKGEVAQESAAEEMLIERLEILVAETPVVDKGVVELAEEVSSARETLLFRENENRSLQASLALLVSENSRLSHQLAESHSAIDRARSQLVQKTTALTMAEAESNKLAAAVDKANETPSTKANIPKTDLEETSSSAIAEAELWLSLLARTEMNRTAERKAADAIVARKKADTKLALLQNSLEVKDRQVHELEQSRSTLIEITDTLLKTVKMRDTALLRAEERIKLLIQQVAQREVGTNLANGWGTNGKINSQQSCESKEDAATDDVGKVARVNWTVLLQELEKYVRHSDKYFGRIRVHASETLLADTITY
jgi:hypothetical protein